MSPGLSSFWALASRFTSTKISHDAGGIAKMIWVGVCLVAVQNRLLPVTARDVREISNPN
jgi:hypothetical protein